MQTAVIRPEAERHRVSLVAAVHFLIDGLSDLVPWLVRNSVVMARRSANGLAKVLYLLPTTLPPQVPLPGQSVACV